MEKDEQESREYAKARLLDAIKMIDEEKHIEDVISMIKSGLGELMDWNRMNRL